MYYLFTCKWLFPRNIERYNIFNNSANFCLTADLRLRETNYAYGLLPDLIRLIKLALSDKVLTHALS